MTGLLIFKVGTLADAKTIVDFWNYYCNSLNKFLGNASVYTIEYDIDTYKILGYHAASSVSEAKKRIPCGKGTTFEFVRDFMTFPRVIQKEMIARSESKSPIPFIMNKSACANSGGFDWDKEDEGHTFWYDVIDGGRFDLFYKHFNLKDNESRLCIKETPFGGDSDRNSSSIRSRFNKARIAVQPLGYQEIIGRG